MKRALQNLPALLMVVGFLLLIGGCVRWEWRECRQVGHGALYCFVQMGRTR